MESLTKKHLSPWIAWSLVALFAGLAAFVTWYYYDQVSTVYDNATSFGVNVSKKAATTTPAATSATADWKTYTNDTYGFSFKYPSLWESAKSEVTTKPGDEVSSDFIYNVKYYDPDMGKKISCANNQAQNWQGASFQTPSKTECDPILSKLTATEIKNYTGPKPTDDIFVSVYKKPSNYSDLSSWLTDTYHRPNTELENYQVGKQITVGQTKGYYSSIGCCGGYNRNYVIEKGDYIYALGTLYKSSDDTSTDSSGSNMPTTFTNFISTFQFTK